MFNLTTSQGAKREFAK